MNVLAPGVVSGINCLRLWLWIHHRICCGPLYRWGFVESLLNEGEYEPDVAQAEQGTCDCAQHPGAFPAIWAGQMSCLFRIKLDERHLLNLEIRCVLLIVCRY